MSKTSREALESLEGARILSVELKGMLYPYAAVLTTTDGDVVTIGVYAGEEGLYVELRTP